MRFGFILIVIALFTTLNVFAAYQAPNPGVVPQQMIVNSSTMRDMELGKVIISENKYTREFIENFTLQTQATFEEEKQKVIDEVHQQLVIFKFTLAIMVFCTWVAASLLADILQARRIKKFKRMEAEEAESFKRQLEEEQKKNEA